MPRSRANATKASFVEAHIYGNGRAFDQANDLSGADFTDALLAGDSQEGGLDLSKVPLSGAHFDGAQCVACNFAGAQLDTASFPGAYLPGAILANTTLTGNNMANAWLYCGDGDNSACAPGGARRRPTGGHRLRATLACARHADPSDRGSFYRPRRWGLPAADGGERRHVAPDLADLPPHGQTT